MNLNFGIQQILDIAYNAAEEKKALDITVLDIRHVSVMCDYFIICSGRSGTQVKSIARNIEEKLTGHGIKPKHREGLREGVWILLDYGDVVVLIFQGEERDFYNLEHLWADAEVVNIHC